MDLISNWDESDRSQVIRKLLRKAISLRKLDYAVRLYQEGKVSIGKATQIADVTIWELHDHLRVLGIQHSSDEEDLEHDLILLKDRHKSNS